jgi:hypothetical protein
MSPPPGEGGAPEEGVPGTGDVPGDDPGLGPDEESPGRLPSGDISNDPPVPMGPMETVPQTGTS